MRHARRLAVEREDDDVIGLRGVSHRRVAEAIAIAVPTGVGALHRELGIQATTWQEIADRAGVTVQTVETYFPTQDDLITACGQHFLGSLQLPPPERAPGIFAGVASEHERVQRLVETIFAAYEREGVVLEVGQRERAQLRPVDEGLGQLDVALDALVAEALRPRRPDPSSVASVRALTDVTVWRALRDTGASSAATIEKAGASVERWLEAHA